MQSQICWKREPTDAVEMQAFLVVLPINLLVVVVDETKNVLDQLLLLIYRSG